MSGLTAAKGQEFFFELLNAIDLAVYVIKTDLRRGKP